MIRCSITNNIPISELTTVTDKKDQVENVNDNNDVFHDADSFGSFGSFEGNLNPTLFCKNETFFRLTFTIFVRNYPGVWVMFFIFGPRDAFLRIKLFSANETTLIFRQIASK